MKSYQVSIEGPNLVCREYETDTTQPSVKVENMCYQFNKSLTRTETKQLKHVANEMME